MAIVRASVAPDQDLAEPPASAVDEAIAERTLIELSRSGHRAAFRSLVERHHRGLYRLAVRMVDRTEAEDIVQETFARAFVRLDDFDPRYRFSTWLYRIALNLCRDHLKSPRRKERPRDLPVGAERSSETPSADEYLAHKDMVARVHDAVRRLSPAYREAIVLKDLEELSYEEMRAITGVPVTALKIRVVRARAKLRAELEEAR